MEDIPQAALQFFFIKENVAKTVGCYVFLKLYFKLCRLGEIYVIASLHILNYDLGEIHIL